MNISSEAKKTHPGPFQQPSTDEIEIHIYNHCKVQNNLHLRYLVTMDINNKYTVSESQDISSLQDIFQILSFQFTVIKGKAWSSFPLASFG